MFLVVLSGVDLFVNFVAVSFSSSSVSEPDSVLDSDDDECCFWGGLLVCVSLMSSWLVFLLLSAKSFNSSCVG